MKVRSISLMREVIRVGVELFVSTYGSTLAAAESMYLVYPLVHPFARDLSFHRFNEALSVPYFPIQIGCGFTIGYLGARKFGTRFSSWLWIIPFINLMWHFVAYQPGIFANQWLSRVGHFIGSGCRPPCVDKLVFTAPFYTSVAYAFGNIAEKRRAHDDVMARDRKRGDSS